MVSEGKQVRFSAGGTKVPNSQTDVFSPTYHVRDNRTLGLQPGAQGSSGGDQSSNAQLEQILGKGFLAGFGAEGRASSGDATSPQRTTSFWFLILRLFRLKSWLLMKRERIRTTVRPRTNVSRRIRNGSKRQVPCITAVAATSLGAARRDTTAQILIRCSDCFKVVEQTVQEARHSPVIRRADHEASTHRCLVGCDSSAHKA